MTRNCLQRAAGLGIVIALLCNSAPVAAQTAPSLGSAQSFAVLGGASVTNTGATVITGDLGVSPGTAVTGFPPGVVVSGLIHAADALALSAQGAVTAAYNSLTSQACTQDLTGQDLGGLTLTPGVYCFSSTAQLTGTLTLNALGNPNAVFIFKIGSALTTASASSVVVINGALSCNAYWQVGSSATLGTSSSFAGNILAAASVTLTTGASLVGRALARSGAVTLDTNSVNATCAGGGGPPVCAAIALAPATLANGTATTAYSQTFVASGGTAPYSFTVTSGTLPAGLALTTAGVLSGIPTAAGTSNFTVRVLDAAGCFTSVAYSVVIAAAPSPPPGCPTITITPTPVSGTVAVTYNHLLTAAGGTGPYAFTVTSGTLPAGITLAPGGVLAGTPTAAGTSSVTVRATDTAGCFASAIYSIVIAAATPPPPACPVITLTPATPANGTVGLAYSQTFVGNGGAGPYSYGLVAGTLPPGLTLTPAGVLAGTPTASGTYTLTVRGTDANGCFGDLAFTMAVTTAVPTLPQLFVLLLALGLGAIGYARLRGGARRHS